jgi:hypothetical protein
VRRFIVRVAPCLCLLVSVSGCSVAALVEENNTEQRLLALEGRVHDLEVKDGIAPATSPSASPDAGHHP